MSCVTQTAIYVLDALARRQCRPGAADFAALARRIANWTTNCVVTAIILVAGIGFGRQAMRWWAADKAEPIAESPLLAATDGLGDPWTPHFLQFGDQPWSMWRQSIAADRPAAAAALLANCRRLIETADEPPAAKSLAKPVPPTDPLGGLPPGLEKLKPAAEAAGKWRLYAIEGGFPMVAGVRQFSQNPPDKAGSNLAEPPRRVVIWGLAVPVAAKVWTLCVFQPIAGDGRSKPELFPSRIELPPGSRKLVSMQLGDGGGIVAFTGPEPLAAWKQFFDRCFAQRGWKTDGWRRAGSTWQARFVAPAARRAAMADIRLSPGGQGKCTGLLTTWQGAEK